ncbi:MAG: 50S ribosomal protein L16 [Planctomycetota bacterium]
MQMMPRRVKYRKSMRGKIRGNATRGNVVSFGEYGLQSTDPGWVTARQLEAGRIAVSHFLRREGKLYIRVFPNKSVSGKPLETRMGKGKGDIDYWCAVVKPGTVLYEIAGVSETLAKQALARVAHKMPVRTRFIHRRTAVA